MKRIVAIAVVVGVTVVSGSAAYYFLYAQPHAQQAKLEYQKAKDLRDEAIEREKLKLEQKSIDASKCAAGKPGYLVACYDAGDSQ